jgi:MFS family permease
MTRKLSVLLVAPFLAQADATIANVATPSIHHGLGASGAALELVIGGYLVAFAVLLITGARLGQTYGYRRMFIAGLAVFSLASLACGLAPSPAWLVAARVVQGAGAALMFPQTLTGIQLNFAGARRIRAIGRFAIALSTGAVVGQVLGGVLVSADVAGLAWRAIFLVNVPIGLGAMLAAARTLPADERGAAPRLDLPGVAMLSAAVLLLVLPLTLGRAEGWPAWTWICLAASLPAFVAFGAVERRVARSGGAPLVNLPVIAPRAVWAGLANQALTAATYFALLFTLAQYLQTGLGRSPLVSGLTLVPWVAAFGLAGLLVRRLPARLAGRAPIAGNLALAAAYAAISVFSLAGGQGELALLPLLTAGGFALGVQFSSMLAHLTQAVAPEYAADLSGVTTTASQIGGALGVAGFGTLYLGNAGPTHAFGIVAAAFAAFALLAALVARLALGGAGREVGGVDEALAQRADHGLRLG